MEPKGCVIVLRPGRHPLEGISVVDLSTYVAGPFAAMMLADLGADVIKVERPPKGDPLRRVGHRYRNESALYINVNRNKRSMLLDLRDRDDRLVFLRLVDKADVLLRNWRPGVAESLDLADDVIVERNPRLIRLSITGYGPDGPLACRPVFDAQIQAGTGLAHRQRHGGRPELIRTAIADKITSMMAAQAVLAALVARARTGLGELINISMLDAVAYFNFPDLMENRTFLHDPAVTTEELVPPSFIVATSDGYIVVAPATAEHIRAAIAAVGHPEWLRELPSARDPDGLATVMAAIESATRNESSEVWLHRFAAANVPVGRVLDADLHFADDQVIHNRIYLEDDHPQWGPVRYPRYPARLAGYPDDRLRRPAAGMGQHDAEVRQELAGVPSDGPAS
jgi:crotonobetainyl-CoA:carnitine CoA-transferase CaiB-like acyl-CoA transferase